MDILQTNLKAITELGTSACEATLGVLGVVESEHAKVEYVTDIRERNSFPNLLMHIKDNTKEEIANGTNVTRNSELAVLYERLITEAVHMRVDAFIHMCILNRNRLNTQYRKLNRKARWTPDKLPTYNSEGIIYIYDQILEEVRIRENKIFSYDKLYIGSSYETSYLYDSIGYQQWMFGTIYEDRNPNILKITTAIANTKRVYNEYWGGARIRDSDVELTRLTENMWTYVREKISIYLQEKVYSEGFRMLYNIIDRTSYENEIMSGKKERDNWGNMPRPQIDYINNHHNEFMYDYVRDIYIYPMTGVS